VRKKKNFLQGGIGKWPDLHAHLIYPDLSEILVNNLFLPEVNLQDCNFRISG
jgi:hypothetical protein